MTVSRRAAVVAVALAAAIALLIAEGAGVAGVAAVPSVLRTTVVATAWFALAGWAPARLLVRDALQPVRPLLVLPLGAAVSSFALAVLGLLHVPFAANLALVGVSAALADGLVARHQRLLLPRLRFPSSGTLLPVVLAAVVGAISLVPIFRSGIATVPGQNGDAVLVMGTVKLIEHHPPTAEVLDAPVNHIPLQWRSKYPIYYALAAVATLAGQDPIAAFAPFVAVMLALTALGLAIFASVALRAPPLLAAAVAFIVPLDRIVTYVGIHPYYNELWGQFALPFFLIFGWSFLTEPTRRTTTLAAIFGLLALLAYPLVVPFPIFFLVPAAIVVRRNARRADVHPPRWLPRARRPRTFRQVALAVPAAIVLVPVALVLLRGFFEKTISVLSVIAPGSDLTNWHGTALPFLPPGEFFGMPVSGSAAAAGIVVVALLASFGLARSTAPARVPLAVMIVAATFVGVYFRLRAEAQLFWFKDMAFLGPYVLLAALAGIAALLAAARRGQRAMGALAAAAGLVLVPLSSAREINQTFDNATPAILQLATWDRELPRGSSVRLDIPPSGVQLWATYMFVDHRICSLDPLGGFFPHPALSRRADYVIAERSQPRPADAADAPVLQNAGFRLWRMRRSVPGPDLCSRNLGDITSIQVGL